MSNVEAKPTIIIEDSSDFFDGLYVHEEKIAGYMSGALQMRAGDIAKTTLRFVSRGFNEDEPIYDHGTRTAIVPLDDKGLSTNAALLTVSGFMDNAKREQLSMQYSKDFSKLASLSLALCAHEEKIRRKYRAASTIIGAGACVLGLALGIEKELTAAGVSQIFAIGCAAQVQLHKKDALRRFSFKTVPETDGELVSFFLRSK